MQAPQFGTLVNLYSPSEDRERIQQVKNALPQIAWQQDLPYLDAAEGMHPDVNPHDIGKTPRTVALIGNDVVSFLHQKYGVEPANIPAGFLTPESIADAAQKDSGMASFFKDVQEYFTKVNSGDYDNGLGPIKTKMFEYYDERKKIGTDTDQKPIIDILL